MSAYRKIFLTMLGVFVVVYLLGAVFYIQQARHDIQRELDAVAGMAGSLGTPASLPASVVASMRHLKPVAGDPANTGPDAPAWFSRVLEAGLSQAVVNGWRIDPADETEEIWEGFVLVSCAYVVGMFLCFLALFQMVSRGLRPLQDLSEAMADVADGTLTSRMPGQAVTELDALATRFNDMALALDNERKTVSRLMNELLRLQDREREHIARVLHDDLGQYLTGIRAQARSWVYDPELNERQKQQAQELAGHCETVQQHFRNLLQDLHPLVLEKLGLASAIRHLVEQWQLLSGLECRLDMDERLPELSGEQQTHLYRFLQEALNNISRHARATCATLEVGREPDGLHVEVRDNGVGSDDLSARAGLGLRSMRERARCLGARVRFSSQAGKGTRIQLALPLPHTSLGSAL